MAMAQDAAKRFHELVAEGNEIPYVVHEPGSGSPLCEYEPQTARFVRDHAASLRDLDSFGSACAALEVTNLGGAYLEAAGIPVPEDPRRRSELASVVFLARLWQDSTDFSLDGTRLDDSINELEAGGEPAVDEIEVVVQLRGLQMPIDRLELATATIVRSDVVEIPAEARSPEGTGTAGWQPTFVAVARIGEQADGEEAPDAGARAVGAFRALVTSLRLFKAGGVGLGPHAWARGANDRWRRIATGEGRPRPGGYVLATEELSDLVALSRALAGRSTPFGRPATARPGFAGALARAVSRFELGLERAAALEALNDYLLSLRFVLEGGGPADLGLPMRVAALCSEPGERAVTKNVVDRALALERELWTGEPAAAGEGPATVTTTIEELARAILKDAACGHLGTDLRATADEILLADGLRIGEGDSAQRGETAEWDGTIEGAGDEHEWAADDEAAPTGEEPVVSDQAPIEDETLLLEAIEPTVTRAPEWGEDLSMEGWTDEPESEPEPAEETLADELEKVTGAERRTSDQGNGFFDQEERVIPMHASQAAQRVDRERPVSVIVGDEGPTPVEELLEMHRAERQSVNDRVAFLFPRPEPCEWEVREVGYDRTRRAAVDTEVSEAS